MTKTVYILGKTGEDIYKVGCGNDECSGCKSKMFCSSRNTEFEAKSKIKCNAGDQVEIFIEPKKSITSTLFLFSVPLGFLFSAIIVGENIFGSIAVTAILSIISLFIGFLTVYVFNKRKSLYPEIIKIVKNTQEEKSEKDLQ